MRKYMGVCLGGPADGLMKGCEAPIMKVALPLPVTTEFDPSKPVDMMEPVFNTFKYQWNPKGYWEPFERSGVNLDTPIKALKE